MFIHFRYHRGTKEIMHGKSLVQVKFQERKRLKIVAKWHSGEGLHVPSCRVRLCVRPVLAHYNRIKRKRGLKTKKADLPVSGRGEPPVRTDSTPSYEQACRTKGS